MCVYIRNFWSSLNLKTLDVDNSWCAYHQLSGGSFTDAEGNAAGVPGRTLISEGRTRNFEGHHHFISFITTPVCSATIVTWVFGFLESLKIEKKSQRLELLACILFTRLHYLTLKKLSYLSLQCPFSFLFSWLNNELSLWPGLHAF